MRVCGIRHYERIAVNEKCEVISLIGDMAKSDDGKASLHPHAVLGLQDGSVRGGHFLSGSVRPRLEVTVNETVEHMRRKRRALISGSRSSISEREYWSLH